MELDYQSAPKRRPLVGDLVVRSLQVLTTYFVISIITLPFLDALWLGELPLLALVQLPKTAFAGWLRTAVVMPALGTLGLSRGSFSPDYMTARPYALAITYLLVLGLVFAPLCIRRSRMTPSRRRWACAALVAAVVDFVFTLWFAGGPRLTVY